MCLINLDVSQFLVGCNYNWWVVIGINVVVWHCQMVSSTGDITNQLPENIIYGVKTRKMLLRCTANDFMRQGKEVKKGNMIVKIIDGMVYSENERPR